MLNLRSYWELLRSSLWFVPSLLVTGAVALALGLVEIDASAEWTHLQYRWPRLFGAGAAGARAVL